ncbi:MAG: hypothetical protein OYH77_03320 [Pseudomonadota bacterium]|nr:hypothetical protein [Pseudomonadota bacterium]
MVRLLILLGLFAGISVSEAYAASSVTARLAAARMAKRMLVSQRTVVSVAAMMKLSALLYAQQEAILAAKDQESTSRKAMPDRLEPHRRDTSPDRVESGDTVGPSRGSGRSSHRSVDSWSKPTSAFSEHGSSNERRGSAP